MSLQPKLLPPSSSLAMVAHRVPVVVPFAPPSPSGMGERLTEAITRPKTAKASGGIQWAGWGQFMTGLATLIGTGAITAAIAGWSDYLIWYGFLIFAPAFLLSAMVLLIVMRGARSGRQRLLAAVEQDRTQLIGIGYSQAVDAFRDSYAAEEQRLAALWTEDAIKTRVSLVLGDLHFTATNPPGQLLLQWHLTSIVGIPHKIVFLGGTCDICLVTSTSTIEQLDIRPAPSVSLDGRLSPDELAIAGVSDKAIVSTSQLSTLRSQLLGVEVARALITMKYSIEANGMVITDTIAAPPRLIELPPWIKT